LQLLLLLLPLQLPEGLLHQFLMPSALLLLLLLLIPMVV